MPNVQTSGTAQKAAGAKLRMACDFGDDPRLIAGATIVSYDVTAAGLVISGKQLDYAYQVSAVIDGGTAGTTYDVIFTLTLNDADASIITCTAPLEVL